jgi:hypothetical protein
MRPPFFNTRGEIGMSPIGTLILLVVVITAIVMVVLAIVKSNKDQMVHSSDQDKIRRVKLTLSTLKAQELSEQLARLTTKMDEKKKADDSTERASCLVDDSNGRGPTVIEVEIRRE